MISFFIRFFSLIVKCQTFSFLNVLVFLIFIFPCFIITLFRRLSSISIVLRVFLDGSGIRTFISWASLHLKVGYNLKIVDCNWSLTIFTIVLHICSAWWCPVQILCADFDTLFRLNAGPDFDLNIFIRFSEIRLSLCDLSMCFLGHLGYIDTLIGKRTNFYLDLQSISWEISGVSWAFGALRGDFASLIDVNTTVI